MWWDGWKYGGEWSIENKRRRKNWKVDSTEQCALRTESCTFQRLDASEILFGNNWHPCAACIKITARSDGAIERYGPRKLTYLHRKIVRKWAWTFLLGLGPFFLGLGLSSWIWAFIFMDLGLHLGPHGSSLLNGPRKSPLDFVNFRAPIFCTYSHLYII